MRRTTVYTPSNPPKSGKSKQIWAYLREVGLEPTSLRFNPVRWGRRDAKYGNWSLTGRYAKHAIVTAIIRLHDNRVQIYRENDWRDFIGFFGGPHTKELQL